MKATSKSRGRTGICSNRAADSTRQPSDFLLTARPSDAAAGKRFFRKILLDPANPQPRVINVDQEPSVSDGRGGTQDGRRTRAGVPATPVHVLE
jgi:transposase-like protein